MALTPVIDIDALLQPISDDAPAGTDPRADTSSSSLYYQTKDARNAARSAERAAVDLGGPPPEEWDVVAETAATILANHAKDLEIAAWFVEALLRQEGFAGLRDGFRVITGIVQNFWEPCFPELDEDGIESKVSAVAGLSGAGAVGTLIQPTRLVPLTFGSLADYSLWNFEQATDLEKITDTYKRQERIDNGAITMEQFNQSVAETPAARFGETAALIEETLAALAEMSAAFDAVAGVDAPPTSALRELLEQILGSLKHFAADKLAVSSYGDAQAGAGEESGEAVETTGADGTVTMVQVRKIDGYASRDEALAELLRISNYFRKTEPHSPISYTLEDAVRRARLTLPELLAELAEDPSHIQRILLAAGIKPPEVESSGY
ncbi:type VI secretion system protein TssA [Metarhizobium album]|uniref:Type VI secretion system protein TssA n=1 Tax=Metarhizobium album TaxID=2182425 RepID=A0A2U2DQQ3_9HYPH|nr:type VI secretion system protein TssA [Rhizobium album]PWE55638.1 type VI secretion system protein TssA [Rhizobium album]